MKQPILYDPAPSILEIIVKIAWKILARKQKAYKKVMVTGTIR